MEKKLRTIEFELNETEKQIEDLLLRIKQLRKEVSGIYPKQKVLYEQHKTKVDDYIIINGYSIKSRLLKPCRCLNYVSKNNKYCIETLFHYSLIDNDDLIPILFETNLIIETYIPSQNLVIIVER